MLQPLPEHGVYTVFIELGNTKIEVHHNIYSTCSEKRDLTDIFMNIEILAWIDSSVYAEYNGASLKEKY